jgi:hypothetical protein
MNDTDLDTVYTRLCTTMTAVGEAQANLFLARFALLAMTRLGDREAVEALIDAAAEGIGAGCSQAP